MVRLPSKDRERGNMTPTLDWQTFERSRLETELKRVCVGQEGPEKRYKAMVKHFVSERSSNLDPEMRSSEVLDFDASASGKDRRPGDRAGSVGS